MGVDVFKIIFEECEYDMYSHFVSKDYILLQILIEIHFRDSISVDNKIRFFTDHGYAIFRKETNIQYSGGECLELGFKDFLYSI